MVKTEELSGGVPKTVIEIWSALAINKIDPSTSYQQAKEIIENTHFDNVSELSSFLIYNKNSVGYQTSVWTPAIITRGDVYSRRELSLKNLAELAENFLYEQGKPYFPPIKILTYPHACKDVESMVKKTFRPYLHPGYNPGPHPRKGEFEGIIQKIVPTLKTTETDLKNIRTLRLIRRQNKFKDDGTLFR
jgi:hypothetical protein